MLEVAEFLTIAAPVIKKQAVEAIRSLARDGVWTVEDLIQSARADLVTKFSKLDRTADPAKAAGWARTVVRRHFVDLMRVQSTPESVDAAILLVREQFCRGYPSPEVLVIVAEEIEALRESLTPRLRQVFDHLLEHGPSASREDLADELGMTDTAARVALSRIYQRLKVTFLELAPYIHSSEVLAHGEASTRTVGL